jgi:hypothetical protein
MEREDHHQHDPEPEHRHAGAEQRGEAAEPIEPRVWPSRRQHAQRHPDHGGDQQGGARQHQGGAEALEHVGQHRPAHPQRAPEIAAHHVADPARILHRQRLLEAQIGAEAREILLGGRGAQHDLGRIAG